MKLSDLHQFENFRNDRSVKVLRHKDSRRDLWELRKSGRFGHYQNGQSWDVFGSARYIISFIAERNRYAKFVGVWEVISKHKCRGGVQARSRQQEEGHRTARFEAQLRENHDGFDVQTAAWARAISLSVADKQETEPHPLFPAHGQEGSGDSFSQIEKAVEAARGASQDITWSLFAQGNPALKRELDSGYLFFPEPTKRYATGVAKWVQDRAAISPWCFLLAVRGALLLRGSLRRLR